MIEMDPTNWALVAVAGVLLALLIVDAFIYEIPWVRKLRGIFGGVIMVLGGIVVGRGLALEQREDAPPPDVEPETFDDEPERKTDAEADDLDLDSAEADRDLAELDASNVELRERLAALQGESAGSE